MKYRTKNKIKKYILYTAIGLSAAYVALTGCDKKESDTVYESKLERIITHEKNI